MNERMVISFADKYVFWKQTMKREVCSVLDW